MDFLAGAVTATVIIALLYVVKTNRIRRKKRMAEWFGWKPPEGKGKQQIDYPDEDEAA